MAWNVGAVIFEDLTKLYLIYDATADAAMRPLFPTEQAARDWYVAGAQPINESNEARMSEDEEPVTIITDAMAEAEGVFALVGTIASRASKKAMWLTGPRSFLEMVYENGATASRSF